MTRFSGDGMITEEKEKPEKEDKMRTLFTIDTGDYDPNAVGLDVTLIKDVTPVPHNGCRPPKRRRV